MSIIREFTLYLHAGITTPEVIHANQYSQGETWIFKLLQDDGSVYVPSTGALIGVKADGHAIAGLTGTVLGDGRVSITTTQQLTAAAGDATCELTIDGGTNGSANFVIRVEKKPTDEAILSESDLSIIQEGMNSVTPVVIAETVSDWLEDNLTDPPIDPSLSISNAAADAKVTGDKITELKTAFNTRGLKSYPEAIAPNRLYAYGISDVDDLNDNSYAQFNGNITSSMVTNLPNYGAPCVVAKIVPFPSATRKYFFAESNGVRYYSKLTDDITEIVWEKIPNYEETVVSYNKLITPNRLYSVGISDLLDIKKNSIVRFEGNITSSMVSNLPVYGKAQTIIRFTPYSDDSIFIAEIEDRLYVAREKAGVISSWEGLAFQYDTKRTKYVELAAPTYQKGTMQPNGSNVPNSSYNGVIATLSTTAGKRYRIDTNGLTVKIGHNSLATTMYAMEIVEFVAKSATTNLCFLNMDDDYTISNLTLDSTALAGVKFFEVNRNKDYYDVVVAAANTPKEYKANADYICDGVNDQVEINCAVNSNIFSESSCNVLLLPGDYYIGKFYKYAPVFLTGGYTGGRGAIIIQHGMEDTYQFRYGVRINGKSMSIVPRMNQDGIGDVAIRVPKSLIDTLDNDLEYSVITAVRGGNNPYGYLERKIYTSLTDIQIKLFEYTKNIIAFDGVGNFGFCADNCKANTTLADSTPFNWDNISALPENLIGIRSDTGESTGTFERISNCLCTGFREAFAIEGEHILMENCGAMWSEIGITVNTRDTFSNVGHNSVYIDNTIERCGRLMVLGSEGLDYPSVSNPLTQAIIYIGGSVEAAWNDGGGNPCYSKPVLELVKNAHSGYIGMEMYGSNSATGASRIAEPGSCDMMKVVNESMKRAITATAPALPRYTDAQPGTELWDGINNRMLYATDNGWITADGTVVS